MFYTCIREGGGALRYLRKTKYSVVICIILRGEYKVGSIDNGPFIVDF